MPLLACVASHLLHFQEELIVKTVDAALEALRLSIDRADPREVRSLYICRDLYRFVYPYRYTAELIDPI